MTRTFLNKSKKQDASDSAEDVYDEPSAKLERKALNIDFKLFVVEVLSKLTEISVELQVNWAKQLSRSVQEVFWKSAFATFYFSKKFYEENGSYGKNSQEK